MTVTVNSGTEGKARGRMEGIVTHRSPPPRWLLHARRGVNAPSRDRRAQDTDSPAGLGDGWVEADDSRDCRYLHGTVHGTDRAGTSRARDREQARTTSTSNNGPPKGACTPAGRPRWGFHPCNHTANTTQGNQGGGQAAIVPDRPGPQACLEDMLAVMGGV